MIWLLAGIVILLVGVNMWLRFLYQMFFGMALIATLIIYLFLNWTRPVFFDWLFIVALMFGNLLSIVLSRRRAGQPILWYKEAGASLYIFLGVILAIIMIPSLSILIDQYQIKTSLDQMTTNSFSTAFMILSLATYYFILGILHLCIGENGLTFQNGNFIQWTEIDSYEWVGSKNNHLKIYLKAGLPFYRSTSVGIALENKEAVDQVVSGRVPHHNTAVQPQVASNN